MNELIKVEVADNGEQIVSARELHNFLEVGTEFRHWFPRMCEYGFTEDQDYTPVIFDHPQNGQPTTDYAIKISMAKEIAMIQRNEKGKEARQYFIEIEKAWNSPEQVMARALEIAHRTIAGFQNQVRMLKPKADYFDALVDRKLLTNIRNTAKELHVEEKVFVNKLIAKGYLYRGANEKLLPIAEYTPKYFEIKEWCKGELTGVQTFFTPHGKEAIRLLLPKWGLSPID